VVAVLFSVLSICAFKRGTARRVSGVHWCMPRRRQMVDWLLAAMLLAGAMFWAMPVLADAQRNHLDLSHDTMRQKLVANDLQAAARTLSWIRRVLEPQ
tara:strand:+ start:219 stop:512 length:294 start_codon:yes stop_codon:yes gene_type:complete